MGLTKERKILIAVAGLAGVLFAGDRALMGGTMSGPKTAAAASGAIAAPTQTAGNSTSPTAKPAAISSSTPAEAQPLVASLAQRLDQSRGILPTQTRDVFRMPAQWQNSPAAPTPSALPEPRPIFDAQEFARQNPLDAVFSANGRSHAVVAGKIVRLGESRDGLTLTEVGDRWVVWSGHGQKFKLHLDPK